MNILDISAKTTSRNHVLQNQHTHRPHQYTRQAREVPPKRPIVEVFNVREQRRKVQDAAIQLRIVAEDAIYIDNKQK